MRKICIAGGALLAASLAWGTAASAADPAECRTVRLADGGWTDNTAQNALLTVVLEGLGYEVDNQLLAVPVILQSLENKDIDIWLDNWMPSQTVEVEPFLTRGTVVSYAVNLEGAGYGPVVPGYVAAEGVKSLADLAPHADKFDRKIYGIEAGNDGNRILQAKIDDPANGLQGWTLVESSEQGMLTQANKLIGDQAWVVFLAWTPHPVMGAMDLAYLDGFEADGFGPATIHTLVRKGYPEQCPNMAALLSNLRFTLDMEGAVMQAILDGEDA
ncbi:MAG TPA: glycine betaine ABC transporter substrate-binding protein, partial [Kiloniellales bacterium]|nr:glycine betaine ABC transporter substrate-binding protein [Kiloniellales bacterium]